LPLSFFSEIHLRFALVYGAFAAAPSHAKAVSNTVAVANAQTGMFGS